MLIDLMVNNMSYNVKLATLIGVENSVYISSLCEILNRAKQNKELEEEFFKIDRNYIKSLTGLSIIEQKIIDKKLQDLDILTYKTNEDKIKLNLPAIIGMICEEDKIKLKNIQQSTKTKAENSTEPKKTARQAIIDNLKNLIHQEDKQLESAYKDWIDGVYANPKGFLSKRSIELFEKTIKDFSNNDIEVELALIDIATVSGYRDATWAINLYNERKIKTPRIKPQNKNLDTSEVF